MEQGATQEPTMEEIVVALRETHRGAGRHAGGNGKAPNVISYPQNWTAGAAAAAELRDAETERLLAENARLNERVVFLLKIIERGEARAARDMDREAMLREVKGTLRAELRPALLVVLRMLERQATEQSPQATMDEVPSAWIVDLIHKLETDYPGDAPNELLLRHQPTLRQRLGRFFHAIGF